jgi:hypothetical protein
MTTVPELREQLAKLRKHHKSIEGEFKRRIQNRVEQDFKADIGFSMEIMKRKRHGRHNN